MATLVFVLTLKTGEVLARVGITMKFIQIFCIFVLALSLPLNALWGEELFSNEVRRAQREKTSNLINTRESFTVIKREIERLEKMNEPNPDSYVYEIYRVVNGLYRVSQMDDDKQWQPLIDKLTTKILSKTPEGYSNKGLQIATICNCMPIDRRYSPKRINAVRNERASQLLEIWQCVLIGIDENRDSDGAKSDLVLYMPPPSFKGAFFGGMSPESITDPEVKKDYSEYLEKRDAILRKSIEQKQAKDVLRSYKDKVKKYIIDSYSIHPFATKELETLLQTHKVDSVFANEILDAVKKAEKDAPPPSDYRNWESRENKITDRPDR